MKRLLYIFIFLTLELFAQITYPKLTGHVVDSANILTNTQKNNIENILTNHENNTSNQVIVVTLKTLNSIPIEQYALELGRHWGIGQKDKNNGVILLVAMQEHKLRIEVGYGLEGALTDKISHEIIEYKIKPEFKKEQYYNGILLGINDILSAIKGEYKFEKKDIQNNNYTQYVFVLAFVLIILFELISKFTKTRYLKNLSEPIILSLMSFIITNEVFQLDILFCSLITIVVFFYLFYKPLKNTKEQGSKESNIKNDEFYGFTNNYSTWGSSNNTFGGGFSGGGGGFGGGGASGGW